MAFLKSNSHLDLGLSPAWVLCLGNPEHLQDKFKAGKTEGDLRKDKGGRMEDGWKPSQGLTGLPCL